MMVTMKKIINKNNILTTKITAMKKLFSILLIATCAFATVKAEGTEDRKTKTVCPGTEVTIQATHKPGYVFKHWSTDAPGTTTTPNVVSTNDKYTFTIPKNQTTDITYYAWWDPAQYKVWYNVGSNTNVSIDATKPMPADAAYGDYTIDGDYFIPNENTCAEITGYRVYAATDDQGNYDASSNAIFETDDLSNITFQLTQNVVVVPVVSEPAKITITIISADNTMGTVSFVDPDSGNTNQQ